MGKKDFLKFKIDNHNVSIYRVKGYTYTTNEFFDRAIIYFEYNNNNFCSEFIYIINTNEFLYAKNKATDRQLKLIEKRILKEFK